MATEIIENAKTQRMGVCNACESLVIHEKVADLAVPQIVQCLKIMVLKCVEMSVHKNQ